MTRMCLTRHGETEWNVAGIMQGQNDSALTERGILQGKWLGERLNEVTLDVIISSSSGRAMHTAELVRGERDIPIIPNDKLMEINLGEWEGRSHSDFEELCPQQFDNFWHAPQLYRPTRGGETFRQVIERASKEVESVLTNYEGKDILIVTHAVVLKALLTYFEGKEVAQLWSGAFMHSTSLSVIEVQGEKRNIVMQGDTSHYQGE